MNLLYISNNTNNVDSGLNWSVPASVNAQQKYDNVMWIDLTLNAFQEHWGVVKAYHNIKEFGRKLSLRVLPKPFDNPDCVIFEGFYYIQHVKFAKELKKKNIPYIIVPRCSLTEQAFRNGGLINYFKKKLAHWLIFNSFIYSAACIQYLTITEKKESEKKYCLPSFIIPNGNVLPNIYKKNFSKGIKGVFIGRQYIYQKGLDLLFESIRDIHDELKRCNFTLNIYGPPRGDVKKITRLINELGINDIVVNHERGVRGEEKQKILLNSDIFILTSRFEGHPMGLIEALSYGLPVFITRGANMFDEVVNNNVGWSCETNKESIVAGLKRMIADVKNYKIKGENARSLATNYDWDILAQNFHDEVSRIIVK